MAVAEDTELGRYCQTLGRQAQVAATRLATVPTAAKNRWLETVAERIEAGADRILAANEQDLSAGQSQGLTAAQLDRLKLTPGSLRSMARATREVIALDDPVGEVIESRRRPNGLEVSKVRVPLGVVFFIYESRPNVTVDAAVLCVKSGNAVILRGGKEAIHSNRVLGQILTEAQHEAGLPPNSVQLVETTDRAAVGHLLALSQYITVTIPRGGEGLIRRVAAEARMPVIKHFDGNCHVYIDATADGELAEQILINSKCQRYGVCNAAESLLVHAAVAERLIPRLARALLAEGVEIRGDETFRRLVPQTVPVTEADDRTEFLGPVISARVVPDLQSAIEHINRHGSRHTDAIVTGDSGAADAFVAGVDSAAVMVNCSTRFNDGGELGLGAEIGISTDKFHARGPCGLKELTTYKWVVRGQGQVRT